jgi:hypothetical protein
MTPAPSGGASNKAPSDRWHILLICAVAVAILAPEFFKGLSLSDSVRFNIVWGDQFRELFRSGELYPRILPRSWGGLGSPTFYFYPPLFFWTASLIDVLTLAALPTGRLISLTSMFFLLVSGLAMRKWLAPLGGSTAALLGAIAYMLAPYHLFDIVGRGAVAEATGYAFLPLILIALRGLSRGESHSLPLLAGSYAGLVLSHLPTALLISVFVIPAYVLFEARRSTLGPAAYLLRTLGGGTLGLGIAACYLVPALSLLEHVSSEALFTVYYSVENWFFWRPGAWPKSGSMILIIPIAVASLLLAGAGAYAARRSDKRSEALFWFGVCAACFVMVSGLLPFLWSLPFLGQVQFPWRLLSIAEFAAITALVIGRPRLVAPLTLAGLAPGMMAATISLALVNYAAREASEMGSTVVSSFRAEYRDAPEYLPAGIPIPANEAGAPDAHQVVLPRAAVSLREGRIELNLAKPQRVEAPLFYFPAWKVSRMGGGEVPAAPSPRGLLSWGAPAGASAFRVERVPAPGEGLAQAISVASLLALLGTLLFLRRRRRKSDFSTNKG